MDRVDVLGPDRGRLRPFRGALLSARVDEKLQTLVREAALRLRCPAGLVTLVLHNVQLFRAQYGLDGELATALALDRTLSFCQYPVRDKAVFEVNDAQSDPRVPQEPVRRYGVRAYLGVPVEVHGETVGAICVIDSEPRQFSEPDRAALGDLARQASARLAELAAEHSSRDAHQELLASALRPSFGELRNALGALAMEVSLARVASAEVTAVLRLVTAKIPPEELVALREALHAQFELHASIASVESLAARIERQVLALDAASLGTAEPAGTALVAREAVQLSHHTTKLVGGVALDPVPDIELAVPRAFSISLLSMALGAVAGALLEKRLPDPPGLHLRVELRDDAVCFWMESDGLDADAAAGVSSQLRRTLEAELRADTVAAARGVGLLLPARSSSARH